MLRPHTNPPRPQPFPLRALTQGRRKAGRISARATPLLPPNGRARRAERIDAQDFATWFLRERRQPVVVWPHGKPWHWRLEMRPNLSAVDAWKLDARALRGSGYEFTRISALLGQPESTVRKYAQRVKLTCVCTRAAACTVHGGAVPALETTLKPKRPRARKLSGNARGYDQDKSAQAATRWLRANDANAAEYTNEYPDHATTDDLLAHVVSATNKLHDSMDGLQPVSALSEDEDDGSYRRAATDSEEDQVRPKVAHKWRLRSMPEAQAADFRSGARRWSKYVSKYGLPSKGNPLPHEPVQRTAQQTAAERAAAAWDRAAVRRAIANVAAHKLERKAARIVPQLAAPVILAARRRRVEKLRGAPPFKFPREYSGKSWYWKKTRRAPSDDGVRRVRLRDEVPEASAEQPAADCVPFAPYL